MPKAQRKRTSNTASRSTPLSTRNANAPKNPSKSNDAKSPKAVKDANVGKSSPKSTNDSQLQSQASDHPDTTSNYIVQVSICDTDNPTITRLLSLPPWLTFDKVHEVLQMAFGWTNSHMHSFDITLVDKKPTNPWGGPPVLSLKPNPDYMPEDLRKDTKAESQVTLADVYEKPEWKNKAQIEYEYDQGDGWNHTFYLLGRATPGTNAQFGAPDDVKVICLGGQGHAAAEDVGGTEGWRDLKDAFKQPRKAVNKDLVSWYKTQCLNGDKKGLDPYAWDVLDVNDELQEAQPTPPEDGNA